MSRPNPADDDPLNPKLSASVFDFLLIELVPMAQRIAADLQAREEAIMSAASRQHLYGGGGVATKMSLPDRTSGVSGSEGGVVGSVSGGGKGGISEVGVGGGGGGISAIGGVGGQEEEDDEGMREKVFFRLDALGYRVGQGLVERFSADQPRPTTQLDCIKFVCKDLWTRVFRKQIDNLKTNHRGTFVLTDNRFQPLARMSVDRKLGPRGVDQALAKAQPFLWFPCGLIRGALSGLGMQVTVHAETTDLPIATFQIRSVGAKP